MNLNRILSLAGTSAAVIGAGTAIALAATPQKITPSGVGQVQIGKTYTELHDKGLIGKIQKGCELAGPKARAAQLKAPLVGSVNLSSSHPRKITDITISGGAKARGVGVGATIARIKKAFPSAKVDHSTDKQFELTFVRVPKGGGGKLEFGVSTKTHKVTVIGVPFIAFCE